MGLRQKIKRRLLRAGVKRCQLAQKIKQQHIRHKKSARRVRAQRLRVAANNAGKQRMLAAYPYNNMADARLRMPLKLSVAIMQTARAILLPPAVRANVFTEPTTNNTRYARVNLGRYTSRCSYQRMGNMVYVESWYILISPRAAVFNIWQPDGKIVRSIRILPKSYSFEINVDSNQRQQLCVVWKHKPTSAYQLTTNHIDGNDRSLKFVRLLCRQMQQRAVVRNRKNAQDRKRSAQRVLGYSCEIRSSVVIDNHRYTLVKRRDSITYISLQTPEGNAAVQRCSAIVLAAARQLRELFGNDFLK